LPGVAVSAARYAVWLQRFNATIYLQWIAPGKLPTISAVECHLLGVLGVKKILWAVIGIGLVVWSGLAWFVHSLIGWGGSVANRNVDVLTPSPEAVEWLSWFTMFGTDVGEWVVVGVWGLGVALALLVGFAGSRLLPGLSKLGQSIGTPQ
jgi:hypothetical protein